MTASSLTKLGSQSLAQRFLDCSATLDSVLQIHSQRLIRGVNGVRGNICKEARWRQCCVQNLGCRLLWSFVQVHRLSTPCANRTQASWWSVLQALQARLAAAGRILSQSHKNSENIVMMQHAWCRPISQVRQTFSTAYALGNISCRRAMACCPSSTPCRAASISLQW